MPELREWAELPPAGTVTPSEAEQPETGGWRTNGRPVPRLDACVNCLLCWLYCPDSAVEVQDGVFTGIDYRFCKGCELCVVVCPEGALEMEPEQ